MNFINIFEVILSSSLMGSIIVLMILITKSIVRNKLTCTFHYHIWFILFVKLVIPFGPQTPLNISNIYEKFYIQNTTKENTHKTQIKYSQQLENIDLESSISTDTFHPSNKNVFSNTMNIPLKNKVNIEKVLCFVWISGVLLLAGILAAGHKGLRETIRASIKDIKITHKEIFYNCMNAMNIRSDVEISYSPKISSPSLCGFIKPKILIPTNVATNVCDEEFKYIIMHELSHLKNKDIFINWVINLLSVIYWFNPILLYGFHKMRQDCEISCDGQVISYLDEGENVQYGNVIIRVLELAENNKRLMGTTAMVMNSSEIKRRIIMISNYKKINIRDILLGTVIVIIIGGLGIAINTSNINSHKNVSKTLTLQAVTPVVNTKSTVNNTSNGAPSPVINASQIDSTKPIVPFLSDIVIYNSHPAEDYPSGMKVTDVGALINDKLIKEGLRSSFIKCKAPTEYTKSYETTRHLITQNVKEYSDTILLDIHRDITENTKSDTRKILFVLAKSNPHYEANKKFVDRLLENTKNSSQVKSDILFYNTGIAYFNQDLSNNSTLINIGNNMSSDSDIEDCVNALVSALKNTQKVSFN